MAAARPKPPYFREWLAEVLERVPLRWRLAAGGVTLLLLAGGLYFYFLRPEEPSPGPLVVDEANRFSLTVPAYRDFMYGIPVVYNEGDEAAELEGVSFMHGTPGLLIVRALVAGPKREANLIAGDRVFPPTFSKLRDVHPLRGYVVAPRREPTGQRGVELVFRLRVPRPGRYVTRGVRLDYRVGSDSHRRVVPNGFAACAVPRGVSLSRDCKLPPPAVGEL